MSLMCYGLVMVGSACGSFLVSQSLINVVRIHTGM